MLLLQMHWLKLRNVDTRVNIDYNVILENVSLNDSYCQNRLAYYVQIWQLQCISNFWE